MADDEEESELITLLSTSLKEKWHRDPDFLVYVNDLCAMGIERLALEPNRLAEERHQILERTQDLAFENYKTFVETAECSREIYQDFNCAEGAVEKLLDQLPEFRAKCGEFEKKAQEIASRRKLNTALLARHTHLLEILEIPQLMDTCVRNAYYEEALELSAHVRQLERKHSGIAIMQGIVSDVKRSVQLMLTQLLQQLRANIQLPQCLKVIGYLRRLDAFSEAELRIKFLQARDAWFRGVLSKIPIDDAYQHASKTMEVSRVHLFDIITQYRAIFSDDEHASLTRHAQSDGNLAGIFHSWVIRKVTSFLRTLEWDLDRGVGGRLDSLLGQCMYFGLSLGRVGADFRSLAAPLFQNAALEAFQAAIETAQEKFVATMKRYTLTSVAGLLSTPSSSNPLPLSPPHSILNHPPLARITNAILTALNDLRACAPISIALAVVRRIDAALRSVVASVAEYSRSQGNALDAEEKRLLRDMCLCVANDFLPFVSRCVETIYPRERLLAHLGRKSSQFSPNNVSRSESPAKVAIEVKELLNPLADLLVDANPSGSLPGENVSTLIAAAGGSGSKSEVEEGVLTADYATSGPLADLDSELEGGQGGGGNG